MSDFKLKDTYRRVRYENGRILYDRIPNTNLPLGVLLSCDRHTKLFITPDAITYFYEKLNQLTKSK